jgi:hypothetical protein
MGFGNPFGFLKITSLLVILKYGFSSNMNAESVTNNKIKNMLSNFGFTLNSVSH